MCTVRDHPASGCPLGRRRGGNWYTVGDGGPVPPGSTLATAVGSVPLSPSGEAGKESSVATDRRGDARRPPLPTGSCSAPPTSPAPSRASRTRSSRRPPSGRTTADELVIVGIPTGGAVLARRLAAAIAEFTGATPAVGTVDPTLYRDDLRRGPARPLGDTAMPDGGLDDRLVVLVDDVLFSGRTVRAALDALGEHGRPRAVQLAVLVDRGHRELPIRADYVGKNVPTALGELDRRAAGRDRRPRRRGAARAAESAEGARRAGGMRHLLSVTDLDAASRDRPARHRGPAQAGAARPRGAQAADAARAHGRHDVLRELHPHPRRPSRSRASG